MPLQIGSNGPLVKLWQQAMVRRFAGYAREADGTPLKVDSYFGLSDDRVQREYQRRTRQVQTGIVSDADLIALGIQTAKPVLFTIEGHMSRWDVGPCAEVGRTLESQGICRWQPVGYDTVSLPFNNQSGIDEFCRLLGDTTLLPPGTPWGMVIFSQGGIVGSQTWLDHIANPSGRLNWRLPSWRGTIAFGNPYRELDKVAEWVPDPPKPGTHGISPYRMVNTPANWKEHSRRGDMYAEVQAGTEATEHMQAVYLAVQNKWSGHPNSLLRQLFVELPAAPQIEIFAIFSAIIQGAMFLGNMGPHGQYDLRPCIDFMRQRLTAGK